MIMLPINGNETRIPKIVPQYIEILNFHPVRKEVINFIG